MSTVTTENVAVMYDRSPHLLFFPLRWAELNSAATHWKNSTITMPRISQTDEVSTQIGGRASRRSRTIEDRGNEDSREIGLLLEVHIIRDLGSVGVCRKRWRLKASHGPDVDGGEGFLRRAASGAGGKGEEASGEVGAVVAGTIYTQGKTIERRCMDVISGLG